MAFDLSTAKPVGAPAPSNESLRKEVEASMPTSVAGIPFEPDYSGERPAAPPADTLSGIASQVAQQFGYGARSGGLGTVAQAGLRAAGSPVEPAQAPEGFLQTAARRVGQVAGLAGDIATGGVLMRGLGAAAPELAKGMEAVARTAPVRTAAVGGVVVGTPLAAAKQYADTGEVDAGEALKAGAVGGALGGTMVAGTGLLAQAPLLAKRSDLEAAKQIVGAKNLDEAGTIVPQQEGQLLTQTTPSARSFLTPATATPEGQTKLADVVSRQVQKTQELLNPPTVVAPIAPMANEPAALAAEKLQKAKTTLGKETALPSEMGLDIARGSMDTLKKMFDARQEAVKPQLEARNAIVQAKADQPIPVANLVETLRANPEIGNMMLSPAEAAATIGAEEGATAGTLVPLPAQRKATTLARYLEGKVDGEEGAGPATATFGQLKVVEKELNRAIDSATDPTAKRAYTITRDEVRNLLDQHTDGAESAFRQAFFDASGDINKLTQRAGSFVPEATRKMAFTKATTPTEEVLPHAETAKLSEKVLGANRQQAEDLITMLGPDKASELASNYLAAGVRGKSAEGIASFMHDHRDFLSAFPENSPVRTNLRNLAATKLEEEAATKAVAKGGLSDDPVIRTQELRQVFDRGDAADLKSLADRISGSTTAKANPRAARAAMTNAVSEYLSDSLAPVADVARTGQTTIGKVGSGIDAFSQKWGTLRQKLTKAGFLTEPDAANVDTLLSSLRVVGKNATDAEKAAALENALTPAAKEAPESAMAKIYGALAPGGVPGFKPKAYIDPMKGINKKAQEAIKEAMFDPTVAARLAKRLEAAKTTRQKAKIIAGNLALKSILAGHYANELLSEDSQGSGEYAPGYAP